jgi:DNA-binding CsgD family transcriptional regulator
MRKIITTSFTNQVLQLRKNNVSIRQTAKKLHVSYDTIINAIQLLKQQGLLAKLHPRDPRTADDNGKTLHTKQLDLHVFRLLTENPKLHNREIVQFLAEPHMLNKKVAILTVERSRLRLIKEGLINRRNAAPEESLQIEKDVELLRKQGLTYPQIASQLGVSLSCVENAAYGLVKKGKLNRKSYLVQIYHDYIKQYITEHPNQPVNFAVIARHLGISREWVRQLSMRVKTE